MRQIGIALLVGVLVAACSSEVRRACTLIGCGSGLTIVSTELVPGRQYTVEVCLPTGCDKHSVFANQYDRAFETDGTVLDPAAIREPLIVVPLDVDSLGPSLPVEITVTAKDTFEPLIEYSAVVEFERHQPNGPGCEPTCWGALVDLG